jgi:hypothetical protein
MPSSIGRPLGPCNARPEEREHDSSSSAQQIARDTWAMLLRAGWLRNNLCTCHPSNRGDVQSRLALAEAGQGGTLFDVLKGVVQANSEVRLLGR